jgi:hypothetical protein
MDRKAGLEHQIWKVKSPFEKGDLGGFQSLIKISPDPPLEKEGK